MKYVDPLFQMWASNFGVWISSCGFICGIFAWLTTKVRPETNDAIVTWLNDENKRYNNGLAWRTRSSDLIDILLRPQIWHFSDRHYVILPSFRRSILFSLIMVILLMMIWLRQFSPDNPIQIGYQTPDLWPGLLPYTLEFGVKGGFGVVPWYLFIETIILIPFLLNLLPDYISLFESRYVIKRLENCKTIKEFVSWLLLDIIATFLIACVGVLSAIVLVFLVNLGEGYGLRDLNDYLRLGWDYLRYGLTFWTETAHPGFSISGIYIYSTFFTSAWIWLYLLTMITLHALYQAQRIRRIVYTVIEVEKHPVLALGIVCIVWYTILFWTTVLIRFVVSRVG